MYIKKLIVLIPLILLPGGCITTPTPEMTPATILPLIISSEDNPYAPIPTDGGMQTAGAILTTINLVERTDLTPARVAVLLSGSLPSVCNELRVIVSPPDGQYRIYIEVFSLVNPEVNCDNVFQQFDATVLLGVYSPGRYSVWINQGLVGDFIAY